MRTFSLAAAICAAFVLVATPRAHAASDEQNLVDRGRITVDDLKRDKEFGNARQLIHRARAIMIVPQLIKGGFFFGGEGGDGLLLTHNHDGSWSDPAFYTLASASFGLQIGLEQSELVLIVLSDRALNAFMSDQFKIGAQAGLAIVTLGAEAEAATTANLNADIVVWSSATGAYAGLTLNGTVIVPRNSYNEGYYGRPENPHNIVIDHAVPPQPGASSLRSALAAIS
jgi:lipid-binding SYLF domain-containing protein